MRQRLTRVAATLAVTGLCTAYLLWKIDLKRTGHVLAHAQFGWLGAALAIQFASVFPMAWRWQLLLRAKAIEERYPWLVRAYFVSYAAGQILPTSLGGDATRIYETSRRHPGRGGPVAGSVVLERALGGVATLILAAAGFALAYGRYSVGAYLWVELAFVVAAAVAGIALFSRWARRPLGRVAPILARIRLDRPLRAVYEGIHAYRSDAALLIGVLALTLVVQSFRVLTIWMAGRAAGVHLSARPYYVMGPLLFLVMLVPFTINGFALRESFFVSFLGNLHVSADRAFSTGFLFFLLTVALALPGLALLTGGGLSLRALRRSKAQAMPDSAPAPERSRSP